MAAPILGPYPGPPRTGPGGGITLAQWKQLSPPELSLMSSLVRAGVQQQLAHAIASQAAARANAQPPAPQTTALTSGFAAKFESDAQKAIDGVDAALFPSDTKLGSPYENPPNPRFAQLRDGMLIAMKGSLDELKKVLTIEPESAAKRGMSTRITALEQSMDAAKQMNYWTWIKGGSQALSKAASKVLPE